MSDEEFREALSQIVKRLDGIETAIAGYAGQDGLMRKVEEVCVSNSKLNRAFWILVGVLIGLGIIGGSTVTVLKVGL